MTSIVCIYRALSIVNEVNLDPSGNGYTNGSLQHGSDGLHSTNQMDLYSTEYFIRGTVSSASIRVRYMEFCI